MESVSREALEEARSFGIVNPIIRKHSSGIELDFRFPGDPRKTGLPKILGNADIVDVEDDFSHLSPSEILSFAWDLVQEERYWETHNYLEELWKRHSGRAKLILHDIIGLIVSQIKFQMGQPEVGKKVYDRSISSLSREGLESFVGRLPPEYCYPLKAPLMDLIPLIGK